ncbi:SEC-C domain-containing protein [Rhizobium hainanense]|nr:SEC-C domain-containing protein [Rhizobium hainanense]
MMGGPEPSDLADFWHEHFERSRADQFEELSEAVDLFRERHEASPVDANNLWFCQTFSSILTGYLQAFTDIREKRHYRAWCGLERVEIDIENLIRNPFVPDLLPVARKVQTLVTAWQAAFPYHVFFSPEIIVKAEICSICGLDFTPWSDCGHRKGKVYEGKLCFGIVQDMEPKGVSLVSDPVQKFSVPFISDEFGNKIDQYDYAAVDFISDRLVSPMDGWKVEWSTTRHPHHFFTESAEDGPCPCGNGRTYSLCCLPTPGVEKPHMQVQFDRMRAEPQSFAYAGYPA